MDALPQRRATWPSLVIAAAVLVWGAYLAVGAATQESQDARKSVVIFGCTVAFLAFWLLFVLWVGRRRSSKPVGTRWNVASLASLATSLVTNALVTVVLFGAGFLSDLTQARLLLSALATGFVTCVLAALGLSQPMPSRGQQGGLVAILLLVVALALSLLALRLAAIRWSSGL